MKSALQRSTRPRKTWQRTAKGEIDFVGARFAVVVDETLTTTSASGSVVRLIAHYDGGGNWVRVSGSVAELRGHGTVLYHCEEGSPSDPTPCGTPGFGGSVTVTMKLW